MSNITINYPPISTSPVKRGLNIPVGTAFMGRIGGYADRLFLRTNSGIVSLNDPDHVWSFGGPYSGTLRGPTVDEYEPVALRIDVSKVGA